MLRLPKGLAGPGAPSIAGREEQLQRVRRTRLGRVLDRLAPEPPATAVSVPADGFPPVGPELSREIDRALELLKEAPFEEIQRRGWHFVPKNWLTPLNDVDFLRRNHDLWLRPRWPEGIDFDLEGQERLLLRLAAHAGELADVAEAEQMRPADLIWDTVTFPFVDGCVYYGLVRERRPKRVVEIGAGNSSIVLARAVATNGGGTEVTLIEPYPNMELLSVLPDDWRVERKIVQRVDLESFEQLEAGDILFYDGSHCVQTAGDVNWVFFEVLPRLQRGVWIHVHDIMWPLDYPAGWLIDNGINWNEQYLAQAFLMHNEAFRLRLSVAALMHARGELIESLFPGEAFAGSVWIEKVA
jgi:predicted O-methyltransferase YrrM